MLLRRKTDIVNLLEFNLYEIQAAIRTAVLTPTYLGHKLKLFAALINFTTVVFFELPPLACTPYFGVPKGNVPKMDLKF